MRERRNAMLFSVSLRAHLLTLLRECRAISHLKQIHSLLITSGLFQSSSCNARILHLAALSLPGDIAYASLVFHQTKSSDASTWNTLVRGYSLRSHHDKAISQFMQMLRQGVVPDEHTYPLVLKVLSKLGNINPDQVHAQIFKVGFFSDSFVLNSLVSSYAKCGNLASARNLFDGMSTRDPIPWTAMIHGYLEGGQVSDALDLFIMMRSSGVQVDEVAIVSVLNGCAFLGNVWLGRCIHGFYLVCGRVKWDVFVGSALVDLYSKCGYCDDARKFFDEMPVRRNVVTWSAMMAGYVQCSRCVEALSLFSDMLINGQTPNEATLASVLTSCAQIGALHQGRWIHGYVTRNKLEENSVVGTALVDMYAKCGSIDDAVVAFMDIKHKDVYPWTALINGLAIHGCALECLAFFSQMIKDGVRPNEVTFIGVLSACSHRALVDQGRYYFNFMLKDYGVRPKMEHYGCMVDLLGRAGMLEEALHLIGIMPMKPSSGVWGALLSACMIHKELELGERVGKLLVEMEPHHSGRYALLANLYSLSKKWDNCANIRMTMKGRRVEKIKGSSWIEINGILHEFFAMDESHPESKDIYETLDGITTVMKLERYVSDGVLVTTS